MSGAATAPVTWHRLLWTSGVVVGASLPHWVNLAPWIPVLLVACVGWRLAAWRLGWRLPAKTLRIVLAFIAFAAVLAQYHTINGVEAGSALLVVMVALKFLEARTQRDQLVLMIIAYFLVFAILLDQQSFWVAMYLLGFVWFTTIGLLQLGRRDALVPGMKTARLAGRLLLQSLPIMLVLFLLFPRLPSPLWAMPSSGGGATSGLSDEMSPGDITNLGLSDEVAFRVEFFGDPPRPGELYWRGPVLGGFNGSTWSREAGMRRGTFETIEFRGDARDYRVVLEPGDRRWLFALDMPREWSGLDNMIMGSDYQLRIRFGGRFGRRDSGSSRLEYRVTSHTSYLAREPLNDLMQRYYTRLPEDTNPRTRELVESWTAQGLSPLDIVEEALALFRDEPFYYTLSPAALGRHTADDFLFETREGFCEHYASAFAIMMRMAGIPTRIVTGYQGGELNDVGEYYIVRQSDAHAWTEVWLDGRGWVRVDPTAAVAPERIELGSARSALGESAAGVIRDIGWVRRAMLIWDAADLYWYDWVVGYGPTMQRIFLSNFGVESPQWTRLILIAAGAVGALLGALTLWLAWSQRSRGEADAAARCFATFRRRLARCRIPPPASGETPAAYGARAADALPEAAPEIRRIVAAYVEARYEPDPNGAALERLRGLIGSFRPSLSRHPNAS
ncbi:MAG: DUF3488 domain-containing transglutaminase family protein [Gammaproteobacteria bacterium]|nr:DUF3488 domain-containing transglutaminase family protein [Gammaproteobacteria bacterium]